MGWDRAPSVRARRPCRRPRIGDEGELLRSFDRAGPVRVSQLQRLQAQAGNRAVAALVGAGPTVVQRHGDGGLPSRPEDDTATATDTDTDPGPDTGTPATGDQDADATPDAVTDVGTSADEDADKTPDKADAGGAAPAKKTKGGLDATAQAIVTAAQDPKVAVDQRAIATVKAILAAYLSSAAGLVKDVTWSEGEPGLLTTSTNDKPPLGIVRVGRYYVEHTNAAGLARRVLQLDHELEHIRQHQQGLTGKATQPQREFLAFAREALEPAFAGTGRVSHATRVELIDAALGNYYCMPADLQTQYKDKRDDLVTARAEEGKKGGNTLADPPSACKPSNGP